MSGALVAKLEVGDLVRLRGREWTIEAAPQNSDVDGLQAFDLARVEDDLWQQIGRSGTDDPDVFAAHLRAVTWRSATAADRNLFQAPFRAGIRLDPYQLLPLAKALRLPRVNLLIADDVGLGKTVEAGLVLREMLLRRRVDYVVISSPAAMTAQWQDELAQKFGLGFTIIDRDYLAAVRRNYGFSANPWAVGSRFIISHNLLADETYSNGLAQLLRPFRPRAMLILDEAHHAAPASGIAYATDSQFTVAVRTLAELFEHRLFLSATPHNGHSNSFSSLLEILAISGVTAYTCFAFLPAHAIFSHKLVVIANDTISMFCVLSSRVHELWALKFGSSMGETPVYNPSDCFRTFPFPALFETSSKLVAAGQAYYDHRAALMVARNEGMTKTYNRFHDPADDIQRLRELHAAMDRAVLEAYGWHDLAARAAPVSLDESNEDDHTYQGRLFWPSDFRDEVLARLLALNADRHAEEVRLGIAPGMRGKAGPDEEEMDDE